MAPRDTSRNPGAREAPGTAHRALTIGEFARRSGLSHKALRLYDLSGLLPPAEVDPVNGYRLYTEDQLARARRISLLRQLDMPLAVAAEVLDAGDEETLARLDRWWAGQQASMRAKTAVFEYLRAELDRAGEPTLPAYEVGLREVAEAKVAAIRREVDQPALVGTMLDGQQEIMAHLRGAGAEWTGEVWWIYHGLVTPDSEAPVEVCVPFTGSVEPAGPIAIRIEPAHTEAYCTVIRDECVYPRIMAAYEAVDSWVRRRGLLATGPVREVYFVRWEESSGSDPFVHVAQPIEGKL